MILTVVLLVACLAALAAAKFAWVRWRPGDEETYHRFRCPGCGQKVRYRAWKAGRPGMCPRCRRHWTLPATADNASARGPAGGRRPLVGRVHRQTHRPTTAGTPGTVRHAGGPARATRSG